MDQELDGDDTEKKSLRSHLSVEGQRSDVDDVEAGLSWMENRSRETHRSQSRCESVDSVHELEVEPQEDECGQCRWPDVRSLIGKFEERKALTDIDEEYKDHWY